jgi:hypothetical protein
MSRGKPAEQNGGGTPLVGRERAFDRLSEVFDANRCGFLR